MGKRKKIWKSDEERRAWDAKVDADVENARALVRKAWAELGIPEPEDKLAYIRQLLERAQADLPARRLRDQPG